jgi:hypothetical protein
MRRLPLIARRLLHFALLLVLLYCGTLLWRDLRLRLGEQWERQNDCLAHRGTHPLFTQECEAVLAHYPLTHVWHSPPSLLSAVERTLAVGDPVLAILLLGLMDVLWRVVSQCLWRRRVRLERALLSQQRGRSPIDLTLPDEIHQ